MPTFRRGYRLGRRNTAATKKSIALKKPTAQNQKKQIYGLAKRVSKLSRRVSIARAYAHYQSSMVTYTLNYTHATTRVWPLTGNPSAWTAIFGEPPEFGDRQKVRWQSLDYEMQFENAITTGYAHIHAYLFKLESRSGKEVVADLGPDLTTSPWQAGRDFVHDGLSYDMIKLNPERFKVLRSWQFYLGTDMPVTATNLTRLSDGVRSISGRVRVNTTLGTGHQGWSSMGANDVPVSQRYYIVMFTNYANAAANIGTDVNCEVRRTLKSS